MVVIRISGVFGCKTLNCEKLPSHTGNQSLLFNNAITHLGTFYPVPCKKSANADCTQFLMCKNRLLHIVHPFLHIYWKSDNIAIRHFRNK